MICCQQMKAFRLEKSRRRRLLPLILIPAVLVSLLVNCSENWIPADDDRQNPAVLQQLGTCISPEDAACYRMEILSDSLVNCNLQVSRGEGSRLQLLGRTERESTCRESGGASGLLWSISTSCREKRTGKLSGDFSVENGGGEYGVGEG